MTQLQQLLAEHLRDWRSGWSMGTFGAVAEFHHDEGEEPQVDDAAGLARATTRGGVRIDADRVAEIVPVAYETLSPRAHRWTQAVAFCLPEDAARRTARTFLTELGPDAEAVRPQDRDAVLFDMGLSLPQCDFCIRTGDPALLETLRQAEGRSLFEPGNPAMPAILAAHPHRVAITNIGRVEVYQKIGGPDTGGVSPPGPHTHLLPKLLATGRTHSANTPIPKGLLPLGSLHPGNPVIGAMGEDRPFDAALHEAFQQMLVRFGSTEVVAEKTRVLEAVSRADEPTTYGLPRTRIGRVAMRLALRQQAHVAAHAADAAAHTEIKRWIAAIEPAGANEADTDDDAPGH